MNKEIYDRIMYKITSRFLFDPDTCEFSFPSHPPFGIYCNYSTLKRRIKNCVCTDILNLKEILNNFYE